MKQDKTYEIERKFLLKNLPKVNFDRDKFILQYYLKTEKEGLAERVRLVVEEGDKKTYFYTRKEHISGNINEEFEKEITEDEFFEYQKKAHKFITKNRFIINDGERDWEIDLFVNIHLIIAEVEFIANSDTVDSVNKEVEEYPIPDFIQECMIEEVSNSKKFSNESLSTEYIHQDNIIGHFS